MRLGKKLDERPMGLLLVEGITPDTDGWSYTILRTPEGDRVVKRAATAVGDYTTEYYEYEQDQIRE